MTHREDSGGFYLLLSAPWLSFAPARPLYLDVSLGGAFCMVIKWRFLVLGINHSCARRLRPSANCMCEVTGGCQYDGGPRSSRSEAAQLFGVDPANQGRRSLALEVS